jgi:hypothetical protein
MQGLNSSILVERGVDELPSNSDLRRHFSKIPCCLSRGILYLSCDTNSCWRAGRGHSFYRTGQDPSKRTRPSTHPSVGASGVRLDRHGGGEHPAPYHHARAHIARVIGVDLVAVMGLSVITVQTIISEIGTIWNASQRQALLRVARLSAAQRYLGRQGVTLTDDEGAEPSETGIPPGGILGHTRAFLAGGVLSGDARPPWPRQAIVATAHKIV